MATRLHSIDPPLPEGAPVVIKAGASKFLAAFWASLADYLPGYVGTHGIARLEPQTDGLPLLLFTEDPTEQSTGTEAIRIEADDLESDTTALLRNGAQRVDIDVAAGTAAMTDPEGNPFTVFARPARHGSQR